MATYGDILYRLADGVAHLTINRPDVYNAFRAQTCEELLRALSAASAAREVGVIVL
ncbi:MAG: enoyl-CoA hydratase-related protein, partial [Gammaproteobacteria bacterium]|nr:enoyl-CoA hydratase-related protein [Gammaproteobacteria bacterium]